MSVAQLPTIEYLRQCVRVENGKVFWLERSRDHYKSYSAFCRCNKHCAGKEAGCAERHAKSGDVRWLISINGRKILRYWIVWAFHYGEWPRHLDHRNRDSLDDRIENLRPATQAQNIANSRLSKANTSGFKGVSWCKKTKKWAARITVHRKGILLGRYSDPETAHAAYLEAAIKHKGEFACSG